MKKKILILSPHADDEILGCGGFISKYSKQNYHINVLVLTNANKGAPEIYSSEEIKQIRKDLLAKAVLPIESNDLFKKYAAANGPPKKVAT